MEGLKDNRQPYNYNNQRYENDNLIPIGISLVRIIYS